MELRDKLRDKQRRVVLGFLLIGLVGLMGCAGSRPAPKMPEPAGPMIDVNGSELPSLTFADVIVDVQGGRVLGYQYQGMEYSRTNEYVWDEGFEDQTTELNSLANAIIREAGYRASDEGPDSMILVGTLGNLSFNTYIYKESFDQAECEVDWVLYRTDEKAPLYKTQTQGAGRVEAYAVGGIRAAFEVALRRLLAQPEFVAAMRR